MTNDTKISAGDLSYICARNRQQAYNLVIRQFKASRLTQAQLARRLGKGTDIISRLLKMPQNWGLNTFSELMYGICGAAIRFEPDYPNFRASSHSEVGTLGADRDPKADFRIVTNDNAPTQPIHCWKFNREAATVRENISAGGIF